MANAKVIIGATGGEIRISEGPGSTGAPGFGTLYVSSSDNKPHFVDTSGTDSAIALGDTGELKNNGINTVYTPGVGATATGCQSVAIGYNTCNFNRLAVTIGPQSSTIGGSPTAGDGAIAIGWQAKAYAARGIALGVLACANNDYTLAIGDSAFSSYQNLAIGAGAKAYSSWGMSIGRNAVNCATNGAFTLGKGTTIIGDAACAMSGTERGALLGNSSILCGSCSTVVGNLSTGSVGSVTVGYNSISVGSNSVVVGTGITTSGSCAISIGNVSLSCANSTIAIGNSACATTTSSIAIGESAVASAAGFGRGIAIGRSAQVTGAFGVAIGNNAVASNTSSVSLGNGVTSVVDSHTHVNGLHIASAPVYADNAAAITGGLTGGQVYKTATGDLKIVY